MNRNSRHSLTRREMLTRSAALSGFALAGGLSATGCSREREETSFGNTGPVVQNGRIKQVLASWPFMDRAEFWSLEQLCEYGTDLIGHIHTAGVPGRGELDHTQELNYPAIIRALLEVGYEGYVGQEFVPTRNPMEGLREAVAICDV